MVEALRRGDRVELRGFGAFSAKLREARQGRNPRTGASVAVGKKAMPYCMSSDFSMDQPRAVEAVEYRVDDLLYVALIKVRVLRGNAPRQ
jgi:hypothetical protein